MGTCPSPESVAGLLGWNKTRISDSHSHLASSIEAQGLSMNSVEASKHKHYTIQKHTDLLPVPLMPWQNKKVWSFSSMPFVVLADMQSFVFQNRSLYIAVLLMVLHTVQFTIVLQCHFQLFVDLYSQSTVWKYPLKKKASFPEHVYLQIALRHAL